MFGNSDGRYAPIGNTSSVIDGEPSHALRALLLRIWRAVFPAVIGNIPQTPADMLSHLWIPIPRSPIGRESIKTGTKADSPDGLYCSGGRTLPPYAQLMGNRFCPTTPHQSRGHHHTDIPQK